MKVVLSKYAGACYGVKRALELANAAANQQVCAVTLGPIIHNPKVVADLAARGICAVSHVDDACAKRVIIRSHGVTPTTKEQLEQGGFEIIDATCPHVSRAQEAAETLAREGCTVVVVGEAGHPEVESLTAYAKGAGARSVVVKDARDIPHNLCDPIGVVVQTTQTQQTLNAVLEALRSLGHEVHVKNTICFATSQRQRAAAELSSQVDVMIVLGGKNSSNTTRLFEICKRTAPAAYHIEGVEELNPAWLCNCSTVGVSAGASTPQNQIDQLIKCLEQL